MSQKEEIVSAIKSLLQLAEKDFNNCCMMAPNGENSEREHFFGGQISAFRKILKYIGDSESLKKADISPCQTLVDELENPSYRRLWDYPLLAELWRKESKN